jgi:hypothetical protein
MIIEYLLQGYVLESNQGGLKHVKPCLVCKRENWQCLQKLSLKFNWLKGLEMNLNG